MDASRRGSAIQNFLKMFSLTNTPTLPVGEEEAGETDEPPDDHFPILNNTTHRESMYSKSMAPSKNQRRESLLTRAILAESKLDEMHGTIGMGNTPRGLSTASSHSAASMASTAELTSDGDLTSPTRSSTPSPPHPPAGFPHFLTSRHVKQPLPSKVLIAPLTKDDKPDVADVGEAAVEKTLGRKRCIMFACGGTSPDRSNSTKVAPVSEKPVEPQVPKRKCALTFACPTRQNNNDALNIPKHRTERRPSPAPQSRRRLSSDLSVTSAQSVVETESQSKSDEVKTPQSPFQEFGSPHDEEGSWVDEAQEHKKKLTMDDCMKKENAIRQLGEEAEIEAEEEEREQEELDEEYEEQDNQDDFAPSDESDGGNESDDEGGFAESDDESDAGSEYQFWAPSTVTTTTNTEITHNLSHFSSRQRSRASSLESLNHSTSPRPPTLMKPISKRHNKMLKMRPGTPELPDSTDFVCGTLDEDRPLEAAYISCREQKKREKHVPIPQDIDPSFPTTDPEDNDDDNEDMDDEVGSNDAAEPLWLRDQLTGLEDDVRIRHKSPTIKQMSGSTPTSPAQEHPFPELPVLTRRSTNRSPPPRRNTARSPPPRKLFGHSPTRLRSPPPQRLRSPRGSPTNNQIPVGLLFNRLAQRPQLERTASLPRTPNPFFRNFNIGSPSISNVASGAVTPALEEPPRSDMHVRGPVDIVIGLEKKRQKRKEKFWRQHCRKAAREQAERKHVRGRGAERMRELGLECAERTRGYGMAQQGPLVLSL